LLHAVLSYGTNWSTIAASHTPQRTTLALKNRYSKLRSGYHNTSSCKESTLAKASSSPSTRVASKTNTKECIPEERFEGDAEDDEGDEEGGEYYEEEEEEGDADNEYGHSTLSASRPTLGYRNLPVIKAAPHDKPNMAKTSEMRNWYTGALLSNIPASYEMPKSSAEQWIEGIIDHTIYPGEGFLNVTQDGSGVAANMSFAGHGRSRVVQESRISLTFRR